MTAFENNNSEMESIKATNPLTIVCPSCQMQQESKNKFCEKCGQDFKSEKIKSRQTTKKHIRKAKDRSETRKNHTHVNDGRILILVIAITSFVLYLLKADYIDDLILSALLESGDINFMNYYKMLSFIPLGIGTAYIGLFFWSFKNIFSALVISLSIFLIETGLVLFFSGVKLHPLYLIYKGVIIIFLIIAVKASLKLKMASQKNNAAI